MEMPTDQRRMEIEPSLRRMILIELIFPMVLLILGIYHGLMQVLYRAGIISSRQCLGLEYFQGLTLHGVVNAIVFTTFFAVAFGYAVMRFHLRRPLNMKVAWLSFGLMVLGTVLAAAAILSGKASVLYTFYPPLRAHPAFYIGLTLTVVGSWVAFFNWIPAYLGWRREHPGEKTPLGVVGIFATFIVWLIATMPAAIELICLLIPWSLGWTPTVNVPLARMLFWFFGHPLVYFWLLPTYVMYYTMLPKLAGGKLFSDFAGRITFLWLLLFSAPVGIHHQFTEPGISSTWKFVHAFFTMLVAVPSFATAFTMAASMEHGARAHGGRGWLGWWKKLPYLDQDRWLFAYFFCGLFIFIFGGVTGIINASYNLNNVVHNTSWMPAHFHQTVAGPVFLSFIGMSLFLVAKLTGHEIKFPGLNVWMPYIWTLGIMIFSTGRLHRRRGRRTAPHEHGALLHQPAVQSLSCRLAGREITRQHRRHHHDGRRGHLLPRLLRHALRPRNPARRARVDRIRAVSRRAVFPPCKDSRLGSRCGAAAHHRLRGADRADPPQ